MTKKHTKKYLRTLAIAPSTRGFGYAVVEGFDGLVNWGVKQLDEDKSAKSLEQVQKLISHYRPELLVLEDAAAKTSRRAPRIRELTDELVKLASKSRVKVTLFNREEIRRAFFAEGKGTKHEIATIIAGRYPDELQTRLPPKRKAWMPVDYRMDIFDAVALALVPRSRRR